MADTPVPEMKKKRRRGLMFLLSLLLIPAIIIALWTWVTLGYTYSKGERAGYVQKLSKKGWPCKTWAGELAMSAIPGAMPQLFHFTVKTDSVASLLEKNLGKRVSLTYDEHRGIPTSCFGETSYFVSNVRMVEP
ncbi:MAG: hypothetical protein ACR2G6_13000 [Gemmatimonadaceae bacterium]